MKGKVTAGVTKHPVQVARRNARERNRVRQVNLGFVTLRNHVPSGAKNKKLSKVETLRQAASYIHYLQTVLNSSDQLQPFCMPRTEPDLQQMDFFPSSTSAPSFGLLPDFAAGYAGENFQPNPQQFFSAAQTNGQFQPSMDMSYGFPSMQQTAFSSPQLNSDPQSLGLQQQHKISPSTSDPSPSSSFLSEGSYDYAMSPQEVSYASSIPEVYVPFSC